MRTEFGQRLLEARKHAKLTQVQLAKAVGMSQANYAELESKGQGSSFTPKIAGVCGVNVDWLAYNTSEMLSPNSNAGSKIEEYGAHLMTLLAAIPEDDREGYFLAASRLLANPLKVLASKPQQPLDPCGKCGA